VPQLHKAERARRRAMDQRPSESGEAQQQTELQMHATQAGQALVMHEIEEPEQNAALLLPQLESEYIE